VAVVGRAQIVIYIERESPARRMRLKAQPMNTTGVREGQRDLGTGTVRPAIVCGYDFEKTDGF